MAKNRDFSGHWRFLGYLFFLLFLAGIVSIFRVGSVECYVDTQPAEEICSHFQFFKGKSLFFVDYVNDESFQKLSSNQNESYSYFLDNISKKLPGTLIINFTTQPPLYRFSKDGSLYLVNDDGRFKKDLPQLDVPIVIISEEWINENEINANEKMDEKTHAFLTLLIEQAGKRGIFFKEIKLNSYSDIELFPTQSLKIILEKNNQVEKEIERINIILNNLDYSSFENGIKEIDMRFNFPVLRE